MRALGVGLLVALFACGGRTGLPTGTEPQPSACPGVSTTPVKLTSIGEFAAYWRVTSMTVVGDWLYYAVNNQSNEPVAIFRVPTTGGTPERVIEGKGGCDSTSPFAVGRLENDGRRLFMLDEIAVGCTGYSRHVVVWDTATSELETLTNPTGAAIDPLSWAPRPLPGGGVAWLVNAHGIDPGSLVAWDANGEPRIVAPIPWSGTGLVVVGSTAYVARLSSGLSTLERVELGSGATSVVGTYPTSTFRLVGANDEAIYLTIDGKTSLRMPVGTNVTSPLPFNANDVTYLDHDWVYAQAATSVPPKTELERYSAKGGTPTTVLADASRSGIQAVTGDACRIYVALGPGYAANEPPVIVSRAR